MSTQHNTKCDRIDARRRRAFGLLANWIAGASDTFVLNELRSSKSVLLAAVVSVAMENGNAVEALEICTRLARENHQ